MVLPVMVRRSEGLPNLIDAFTLPIVRWVLLRSCTTVNPRGVL